jgi:hypothetical protein
MGSNQLKKSLHGCPLPTEYLAPGGATNTTFGPGRARNSRAANWIPGSFGNEFIPRSQVSIANVKQNMQRNHRNDTIFVSDQDFFKFHR